MNINEHSRVLTQNPSSRNQRIYLPARLLLFFTALLIYAGCKKSENDGPKLPVVTTAAVNTITPASAKTGGNITSDGGASVTARGVCWNTAANPTISNSKTSDSTGSGNFTSIITGLAPATTYYVRAYATNSEGTAYGDEVSFATLPVSANSVMDIDGNSYDIVTIGTQVWMQQNLRTSHYRNGDLIQTGLSDAAWGATGSGAYSIYGSNSSNDGMYGKLYNWFAVVDPRNIAPAGWHVPTETDWQTLINFLEASTKAGGAMKEAGLTHWTSPNTGASNSSGFFGLPGGYRDTNGSYGFMGNGGWWWSTAADFSPDEAKALGLFTNSDEAIIVTGKKTFGASVRCLKD